MNYDPESWLLVRMPESIRTRADQAMVNKILANVFTPQMIDRFDDWGSSIHYHFVELPSGQTQLRFNIMADSSLIGQVVVDRLSGLITGQPGGPYFYTGPSQVRDAINLVLDMFLHQQFGEIPG